MSDRIDLDITIDIRGLDDERVAVPVTNGFAPPARCQVFSERAAIGRDKMEPRVLLRKKNDLVVVLYDLNRMGTVNGAWKPKRQATARIITVLRGIVAFPLLLAPRSKWKFFDVARCYTWVRDIGTTNLSPHTSHARFSIRQFGCGRVQSRKLFSIRIPSRDRLGLRDGIYWQKDDDEQHGRGGDYI